MAMQREAIQSCCLEVEAEKSLKAPRYLLSKNPTAKYYKHNSAFKELSCGFHRFHYHSYLIPGLHFSLIQFTWASYMSAAVGKLYIPQVQPLL